MDFKDSIVDVTLSETPVFKITTNFSKIIQLDEEEFELNNQKQTSTEKQSNNDQQKQPNIDTHMNNYCDTEQKQSEEKKKNPYAELMEIYLPQIAGAAAERLKIDLVFDSDFMLGLFTYENYVKKLFKPNQKLLSFHVGIGRRTFCSTLALLHKTNSNWNFYGCDKFKGDPQIFLNGPKKTIDVFGELSIEILEKQIIERLGIRPFGFFTFDIKHENITQTIQAISIMFICLSRKGTAVIRLPDLNKIDKSQYNYVFYLLNSMFSRTEIFICPWNVKYYLICTNLERYNETYTKHFIKLHEIFVKNPETHTKLPNVTIPDWVQEALNKTTQPIILEKQTELSILELFD